MGSPVDGSPEFATNKPSTGGNEAGERVADALNAFINGRVGLNGAGPEVSIATAYFNPGGFNLIADQLERVDNVRLLLGADPAEAGDRPKQRQLQQAGRRRRGRSPEVVRALEGHARSLEDDRDLVGFTREADSQARRLVAWLRNNPNVEVRRYERGFLHGKAFLFDGIQVGEGVIAGSSNFTYAGLARNNELNLGQYQPSAVGQVREWFNEQWTASAPYDLAALYEARWAPHQPWDVFLRMLFELYGADLEEDTNTTSRLGLTKFQADGVWRAKRILTERNGVLVADEVGLGKTFLAGELIYEATYERRQKVLVVAPATLRDSTWHPFLQKYNLRADVLSFEKLVADIEDAGTRHSQLQALDKYAMVIVDEAHAMRTSRTRRAEALRMVLAGPVPKDLVLLTATPVNNSLMDLYNLITYFTPSDAGFADVDIPSLRDYFADAMATNPDDLSPEQLFDVLDEVAIRRTRKFVKKHYVGDKVVINGEEQTIKFPTPRVRRVNYNLNEVLPGVFDDLAVALGVNADEDTTTKGTDTGVITTDPGKVLTMARYVPSRFLLYGDAEQYEAQNAGLIRTMLLKRFESSSYAFRRTLEKMIVSHNRFLDALDSGLVLAGDALREWAASDSDDVEEFFEDLDENDHVTDAALYEAEELQAAVIADLTLLEEFRHWVAGVTASNDPKVKALVDELVDIAEEAHDEHVGEQDERNKRKVLVFTYYADTAAYLKDAITDELATNDQLAAYRGRFEVIAGPDKTNRATTIIGFAPKTAGEGTEDDLYDLIVTTDVLAEGVNLQQARHIINYDLPWNPMRLVQRHGRIDRIGSPHSEVFLRCFFPDTNLDAILELEARLQRKLKQAAASIGTPRVLPGIDPVEQNLAETRTQIDRIRREEANLFEEAGGAALSGEEYRRRLANAFSLNVDTETKNRVLALPWGSGAGHARGSQPGIIFCSRIGDHAKPWFRYVALNDDYTIQTVEDEPVIFDDTLTCLDQADPGNPGEPPGLTEAMHEAAFDAWAVAREHIYNAWTEHTDPANLRPSIPKAMRDATELIATHGHVLGDQQEPLRQRLNAPYPIRVLREVRRVLDGETDNTTKAHRLAELANAHGLTAPPEPQTLPPITHDDIHVICWIAVTPEPTSADTPRSPQ